MKLIDKLEDNYLCYKHLHNFTYGFNLLCILMWIVSGQDIFVIIQLWSLIPQAFFGFMWVNAYKKYLHAYY